MALHTYIVEGGVGKCVAFTALVDKLADKAGEPIQVHTPYFDCFAGNPNVRMVYDANTVPLHVDAIISSDLIEYAEPYKSNFIKGQQHIIESYANLHGVEFTSSDVPKLYTDHLKAYADEFLIKKEITGKFILVQFTGGQSPLTNGQGVYQSINPSRNYPHYFAQQVVSGLKTKFPDVTIINCTMPNEPNLESTVRFEGNWPVIHELMKRCEGFVGIDSMLNHLSASAQKSGVVVWGNTSPLQYGYSHNKNVNFHNKLKYNASERYDLNDPRNIMVEPEAIIDVFSKDVFGKTIESAEVKTAN